ncbi:hypothetical protein HJC23_012061 [Cyclotella cryptica]|uniref:CDP-diacylglycerol--glycerol-3-phosphate 3-phosphatidyltransferase n=1 Tax=Cyclotella cryptica TaxID=29204 RepID=A0ABD3PV19_9STRA|eukprot:CCRYP_011662-RA/>CCRYP_011662-RA protein AED:0.27 eAED:0.27 QI:239/1/1/1/1/1/3/97/621
MTWNPQRKTLVHHFIRAARGGQAPTLTKPHSHKSTTNLVRKAPLPCFALHGHHFGRIVGSSHCVDDAHNANTDRFTQTKVPTPSDFHSHLCHRIRCARERVVLASLYIGVGSNRTQSSVDSPNDHWCKEDELLEALKHAASNPNIHKIQILLDANRALRKVSYTKTSHVHDGHPSIQSHSSVSRKNGTYSAKAVHSELTPFFFSSRGENRNGVFLFPVNNLRLCSLLPSPLGEVAGVFHIKAYIIDNELILSGANLSEEYFTNRLDRYMSFVNGGGGLVDFYADLCDVLSRYAVKYDNALDDSNMLSLLAAQYTSTKKQELEASLMELFNGERRGSADLEELDAKSVTNPIAYAIPTFQMPQSFLGRPLNFPSDSTITRQFMETALEHDSSASVRLSSAYLNLTPSLLSILTKFGRNTTTKTIDNASRHHDLDPSHHGFAYILTAGTTSHGFAPKRGSASKQSTGIVGKIKDSIPVAFLILVKQVAASIIARGGKVLLYERPGWTFHAKGVWITVGNEDRGSTLATRELIDGTSSLVGTIIGSGNYGARSEDLDVESNLVLIFNDSTTDEDGMSSSCIKTSVAADWNDMCKHSREFTDVDGTAERRSKVMNMVVGFLRRFL